MGPSAWGAGAHYRLLDNKYDGIALRALYLGFAQGLLLRRAMASPTEVALWARDASKACSTKLTHLVNNQGASGGSGGKAPEGPVPPGTRQRNRFIVKGALKAPVST